MVKQGIIQRQRTGMVLYLFWVFVRSAKISASKIKKAKKLFMKSLKLEYPVL
jgi:hypothetical protein